MASARGKAISISLRHVCIVTGVVFHGPQVQRAAGCGTLPLAQLPRQDMGSGGNITDGCGQGHGVPLQPMGLVRPTLEHLNLERTPWDICSATCFWPAAFPLPCKS